MKKKTLFATLIVFATLLGLFSACSSKNDQIHTPQSQNCPRPCCKQPQPNPCTNTCPCHESHPCKGK